MITDWRVGLVRVGRALRRSLWILVTLPVLAALTAGALSIRQVPQYQAQAQVLIRAQSPTEQVTQTYANMMVQRPLLHQVVRDLRLTEQPESLSRRVSVTIVPGTTILNVAVTSSSPQLARDIANALVNDFIAQVRGIQQQEAATRNTQSGDNLVVLAPATTPQQPISPNVPRDAALAAGAALLAGLIIAGAREYLDQTVRSDDEMLERVGLAPIGHVPYVRTVAGPGSELVALQAASPVAESYRKLRMNLVLSCSGTQIKSVIVTSPTGNEGKSRTAANLAISLAQAGHRTVLLDLDRHRPSLNRILETADDAGPSRLATEVSRDGDMVVPVRGVVGLSYGSGVSPPPTASGMYESARIRKVLAYLRDQFDYVIIDTASVGAGTDACELAAIADASILVVEGGRTTYHMAASAKRALEQVGARLAGVVVNKLRGGALAYYGYHDPVGRQHHLSANGWTGSTADAARSHEGTPESLPRQGGAA